MTHLYCGSQPLCANCGGEAQTPPHSLYWHLSAGTAVLDTAAVMTLAAACHGSESRKRTAPVHSGSAATHGEDQRILKLSKWKQCLNVDVPILVWSPLHYKTDIWDKYKNSGLGEYLFLWLNITGSSLHPESYVT